MRLRRSAIRCGGCGFILLLVSGLIFCVTILAAEVKGLDKIYETPIPIEIRRNFDEYLQNLEYCRDSECGFGFIDSRKFINIYTKKFIVIGVELNGFGGLWAIIAVEGEAKHVFRLWLYDTDKGVYDLRSIEEISGYFGKHFMKTVTAPEYSKYWF